MTFMNKKEEVLDIKLTQYGKKLLSEGKFNPVYYSFHDEGVLYDSQYASYEEDQNNIEGRILNDTPSMRTQHNFTSAKESGGIIRVKRADDSIEEIDVYQIVNRAALGGELGHSELNTQNFPSLKLKIDGGEITSVDTSYTDDFGKKIPQIECQVKANIQIRNVADAQKYEEPFQTAISPIATDGTYLSVNLPNFILEMVEENVDFDSENFDIEVFKIKTSPRGVRLAQLTPLNFVYADIKSQIVNGILIENPEDPDENFVVPTIDNVEYFFNLVRDDSILPEILDKANANFKSRSFYSDKATTSTRERTSLTISDIYSSTTDPSDIEDCG